MLRTLHNLSALAILALGGCVPVSIPFVGVIEPAAAPASNADQAMAGAYARMADDVRAVWGDRHMEMPSDKAFVYYEDGMAARTIMDFEAGELRVERVLEAGEDEARAIDAMRTSTLDAIGADTADLARKDTLMRYVAEETKTTGARFEATEPAVEDAPLLATLVTEPAQEVRRMITRTIPSIPGFYGQLAARYADDVMTRAHAHDMAPLFDPGRHRDRERLQPARPVADPGTRPDADRPDPGRARRVRLPHRRAAPDGTGGTLPAGRQHRTRHGLPQAPVRALPAPDREPGKSSHGVIAAYNTGAGNVARSFTGRLNVATWARRRASSTP